jgi:hypothetical protein
MKAIETQYNNQLFRSRLEAKWAAMFDLLGWEWFYEPFDLDGYIPDFILGFNPPLLVEVKPELDIKGLEKHILKIERSGWDKEILIVGAVIFESYDDPVLGLLGELFVEDTRDFGSGILLKCNKCKSYSIRHETMSWKCRKSGCYDGDGHLEQVDLETIEKLWKQAYKNTRWLPKNMERQV